jgi:insulysin
MANTECTASKMAVKAFDRTALVKLILILSILPLSRAFRSICHPHEHVHWHSWQQDGRRHHSLHLAVPNRDDGQPMTVDQIRRRQILVSMLAAASARPSEEVQAAAVVEASLTNVATQLDAIIVPPLDDREYFTYVLDNGLRVLLCSDPSSNDSAAAMDVHVGAFSDPVEISGLAHFNEHMLFLGTKPYPKEDSFEAFLGLNGGSSNAYTDSLDTVYYFEMEAEAESRFAEGLNRFGCFFSVPLFTESATGRELNAIESENAKNLQSDTFRIFQMNKSRANPNHPFSKFSTGNKKTLLDDTQAQNIDLRSELIKFYDRYYSANQMTLAIVAPLEINELQKLVQSSFSDIPNRGIGKPEEAWKGILPFKYDEYIIPSFGYIVEVVPVQEIRQVTVAWPFLYKSEADLTDARLEKASNYVAHLLGHEGPGSLLSYLKRRGWANSIAAATEEELSDFETFEIVVGLTRQGLVEVESVIEAIYSYLSMLRDRSIPNYIFEEVLQLAELQWRFSTKTGVAGYIQSLAAAMQRYPPALYLAGPRRLALSEFAKDPPLTGAPRSSFVSRAHLDRTRSLVNGYLDFLTVDNALVTVISKAFENQADRKEKWYGTDYRIREISSSTLDRWRDCEPPGKLKMNFPKENPFIPSETGLRLKSIIVQTDKAKKRSFESRMEPPPPPRVIRDDGLDGRWTVFFKQDDHFGKPNGFLIFQVQSKEVFRSPMNAALANIFELCVTDRLTVG